jgi:hypothetical protein
VSDLSDDNFDDNRCVCDDETRGNYHEMFVDSLLDYVYYGLNYVLRYVEQRFDVVT